ncbi:MAG: nitrous oxide reductase family maturation protein NosD [Magnetococcales bacterium]|nr:nitrous oxide reductase family maturation protein NosD [Alphaproteobacteria bacterium]MBF0144160.1 nitrous oxide reductase family maturation protein NosD [Magnetococcales bacterium]
MAGLPEGARASTHILTNGDLRSAIAAAAPGDVLHLPPGVYDGQVVIDKPLVVEGEPGAVVEGTGTGSVIRIEAAGVTVRGLTIRKSGIVGADIDAGIYVDQKADDALIENNRIEDNLFGIALHGSRNVRVLSNRIRNASEVWLNERGDGMHVWSTKGALIEGNTFEAGRDGIFITSANGNIIRANRFHGVRFAVHYMWANRNEITDNVSVGNHVGYALMYSDGLKVLRNVSINDEQHGLMFHTSHKSDVAFNVVKGTHDKGAFIYTATGNTIHDNRFEGCGIGMHFSGGSESNTLHGNAFVDNKTQVKYTGTVFYEWSKGGRGNFWSGNPAFDLNGDRVADVAYRPNTLMDVVVWKYPLAKLLLSSPAMETLRYAQARFPALYPGGVVDSFPLMESPVSPVAIPTWAEDRS